MKFITSICPCVFVWTLDPCCKLWQSSLNKTKVYEGRQFSGIYLGGDPAKWSQYYQCPWFMDKNISPECGPDLTFYGPRDPQSNLIDWFLLSSMFDDSLFWLKVMYFWLFMFVLKNRILGLERMITAEWFDICYGKLSLLSSLVVAGFHCLVRKHPYPPSFI